MFKIWQEIYKRWAPKKRAEFWFAITALVAVIASIIVTSRYLGKLLAAIASSQKH